MASEAAAFVDAEGVDSVEDALQDVGKRSSCPYAHVNCIFSKDSLNQVITGKEEEGIKSTKIIMGRTCWQAPSHRSSCMSFWVSTSSF